MKNRRVLQAKIYTGGFERDYTRIKDALDTQFDMLEKYAEENLLLPIEVKRSSVGFGRDNESDVSIVSSTESAIKKLHADMYGIADPVWQDLIQVYNAIEKNKVTKGVPIKSTKQTMVMFREDMAEIALEIAKHMQDKNLYIPYMLRKGNANMQLFSVIAVVYVSRHVLQSNLLK